MQSLPRHHAFLLSEGRLQHTNHAKDGCEDVIENDITKGRNGSAAPANQRGGSGTRACGIRDEGRTRAILIAAAFKLKSSR